MTVSITQLFAPVVLATTEAVLFSMPTAPSSSVLKNGRIRLVNTTAAAVTATLYCAASATASSAANMFLPGVSLGANSFTDVDVPVLAAGDTLRGKASAATSITAFDMDGNVYS